MSTETTSSMVVPVTTSSLVTTAAPVTTTVNNPPPVAENPPATNENVIKKNQFSYDDTSKILTIMMIILPILAIFLGLLLKLKFEKNNYIRFGLILILISNVIVTILLAVHYRKLRDATKNIGNMYCTLYSSQLENEPWCIYKNAIKYVIVSGLIGSVLIFIFLILDFVPVENIRSSYNNRNSSNSYYRSSSRVSGGRAVGGF
jgi:uncharacterized membrane protein YhaH (DUF805 family)